MQFWPCAPTKRATVEVKTLGIIYSPQNSEGKKPHKPNLKLKFVSVVACMQKWFFVAAVELNFRNRDEI